MKNRLYQSLFLGITSAIAASASYALITPQNEKQAKMEHLATANTAIPSLYDTTTDFLEQTLNLEAIADLEEPIKPRVIHHRIQADESLGSILSLYDIDKKTLKKITRASKIGAKFKNLESQKVLTLELDETYQLHALLYDQDEVNTLIATKNGRRFDVHIESKTLEQRETLSKGTIYSSLAIDGKNAGLSTDIIKKLTDKIFAWDIDFSQDLHPDDKFTVIYEETLVNGRRLKTGAVLAAEFIIEGKSYAAIRYKNKEGQMSYYSPQNQHSPRQMRKTFLRSPIAYTRISSYFNFHRKHPVLNHVRQHKGVDYAAKTGTPINVTGGGKIIFRGRQRGYGKVIIVQHSSKYKSLYGHLSKFNRRYRLGSTVEQGDVIGYVGQTGLASGPHLHYEFLVNGVHKNPLTVKLPQSSVADNQTLIARFKAKTQPYLDRLNQANTETAQLKADHLIFKKTKPL